MKLQLYTALSSSNSIFPDKHLCHKALQRRVWSSACFISISSSLVCRTRDKLRDWIALNLVHQCSHNKALKSRSQDSAATSELHEKAPDPLHGCGKVTEYFLHLFLSHKARIFIFYFIHSVVLVTASPCQVTATQHLAGRARPPDTACTDRSRRQLRISAACSKIPVVLSVSTPLHEPDRPRQGRCSWLTS